MWRGEVTPKMRRRERERCPAFPRAAATGRSPPSRTSIRPWHSSERSVGGGRKHGHKRRSLADERLLNHQPSSRMQMAELLPAGAA